MDCCQLFNVEFYCVCHFLWCIFGSNLESLHNYGNCTTLYEEKAKVGGHCSLVRCSSINFPNRPMTLKTQDTTWIYNFETKYGLSDLLFISGKSGLLGWRSIINFLLIWFAPLHIDLIMTIPSLLQHCQCRCLWWGNI